MYSSSTQREDEIKNMSSVFNELKKDILPQLRRSVIVNTIDLEGKTDAEMMALVEAGKLDQLNLNESLLRCGVDRTGQRYQEHRIGLCCREV